MQGIRVRGTGHVARTPDSATAMLGVETQAPTAGEAQTTASARMRAAIDAISTAGVAPDDISTRQVSLSQTFDYSGNTPRATGYQATQGLAVRVRDLSRLGPVIDAAVTAGANQVSEVTLELTDPAGARAEARDLAMADARHTAEALARAGGVRLGLPIGIREGGGEAYPPQPMFRGKAEMAMVADTPIAAGQTDIEVSVEVTWGILG